MGNTSKEIYNDKFKVRQTADMGNLAKLLKNCGYGTVLNNDRSLLITDHEEREVFNIKLSKNIQKWLKGIELTCHIKHVYNPLPINHNTTLVKL